MAALSCPYPITMAVPIASIRLCQDIPGEHLTSASPLMET